MSGSVLRGDLFNPPCSWGVLSCKGRMLKVTVTGVGYLGLIHAVMLCERGNQVLAMDVDETKIKCLQLRGVPFHEPGLGELVKTHTVSGSLKFTTSPAEVANFGSAHYLCTGTPVLPSGHVDLHYLFEAAETLAGFLPENSEHLFIGKSTTPPGTAKNLLNIVKREAPDSCIVDVAWEPEFLREGTALNDALYPARRVFGVNYPRALMTLREIHGEGDIAEIVMDVESAELAKLASNAFLAMKISFINGISDYCKETGADVDMVAWAMGTDPRIGRLGMKPGLGYGGGCLPKDLTMLVNSTSNSTSKSFSNLLRDVHRINMWRREQVIHLAKKILDVKGFSFAGFKIGVLGLAFKAGTDDMRDSPGLYLAEQFADMGAVVLAYDPWAHDPDYSTTEITGVMDADLVIVATDHYEYARLDPSGFPPGKVIDTRFVLNQKMWEEAGWEYHRL